MATTRTVAVGTGLTVVPVGDLLGHGHDTVAAVGRELHDRGVARSALRGVRHLSGTALRTVDAEVARVLDGLLRIDVGEAFVMGWRKHGELVGAAGRTLEVPGSEEVVVLATHRISWESRPAIDLYVGEVKVTTFDVVLRVVADIEALIAIVGDGALVALRGGVCRLSVTLTLDGGTLAHRDHTVDLQRESHLQRPVPLVARSEGDGGP